ncbi:MAG: hypothetical protein LBR06_00860 [Bacteroidales bacterium]|nr:hypothetical protein [Bacteroidales bacterium]
MTGSAVPADNVTEHTGTGRITRMLMRTMSLYGLWDDNYPCNSGFSVRCVAE